MNWFKLFPGDYAKDTAHLSLLEHGVYLKLLIAYYGSELPLPADTTRLARICSASTEEEVVAVEVIAERYFPLNGDGARHNERADKEIKIWQEYIASRRAAGHAGGIASAQARATAHGQASAQANQTLNSKALEPDKTRVSKFVEGEPEKPCAKCGGPRGAWTQTSEGRLCPTCWRQRQGI